MTVYRTNFTYTASDGFVTQVNPTDVFTISGSATSNVYVTKITFSCYSTDVVYVPFTLLKRSTPNTGGTFDIAGNISYDTNNPASAAVVKGYTVNPVALGTLVGTIWANYVPSNVVITGTPTLTTEISFQDMFAQPLTLLSPNESLCLSFGANAEAITMACNITWYELSKT